MPLLEMPQPITWLVLAWLFAVGGCIGSFMNVVIYRLPAGLSLLHPPSRCPMCETRIRPTDNVPILGWLWLRGRCRSCGAAISARYPAVELLVALLFVGLAWVEPLSGGSNLPSQSRTSMAELWGVYAYHLFLLCSLICAAFTEFDGHRLTWRLALPALAIGLFAPLLWPHLRPTTQTSASLQSWVALMDGLLGAAAGGLVGLGISVVLVTKARLSAVTEQMSPKPLEQLDLPRPDVALALAWVGAFLDWPAAIAIAMASITTFALHRSAIGRLIPALNRLGLLSHIAAWTLIWIILWRQIFAITPLCRACRPCAPRALEATISRL